MSSIEEFIAFCDHVNDLSDEDWSMTWLDTRHDGQTLVIRLRVNTYLDDVPNQVWQIWSDHVRALSLSEFEFTDWTLSSDHVLLWDYQEPISQLNFIGPSSSHEGLLWSLYERHRLVAGHWIPFERYINDWFLRNRLSGGTGVLAQGPDRLAAIRKGGITRKI